MIGLIDRRIGLLFVLFVALLCAALLRAGWLGVVRAPALRQVAQTQQVSQIEVPAPRGAITDRNGVDLAVSEPAADISADPYLIKRPQWLADRLAPLLGQDANTVLRALTKPNTGFVYLARQLPSTQAQRIARFVRRNAVAGINQTASSRRIYPQNWLASQVLGTVGIDNTGLSGIEYARNGVLEGANGERRIVNNALGDPISLRDPKPVEPGHNISLTLDTVIQGEVEDALQDIGSAYSPKGATAIVMDPRTSQVLALANWPRVSANDVAGAPAYAAKDRAVGSVYEPGSTFKAITVAGALQDGVVTPETSFNLPPVLQIGDRTLHDAEDRGWETLTTAGILAKSSNIGAVTIASRLGKQRFDHWVRRFGFGTPSGVGLPGDEAGIVLKPDQYSDSSMGNMPIGQGIAVTPMQIAAAYAAIANGGILRSPQIVRAVNGRPVPEHPGHRIISERTAAQLRTMLEGVLAAGGTASEVSIPGYQLAGKTGTANKPDPVTGGYSDTKYVASFVGFAPADHPRLLVAVMVDEPQGDIYGGSVAAPAFAKIASFALPYLRIPPG